MRYFNGDCNIAFVKVASNHYAVEGTIKAYKTEYKSVVVDGETYQRQDSTPVEVFLNKHTNTETFTIDWLSALNISPIRIDHHPSFEIAALLNVIGRERHSENDHAQLMMTLFDLNVFKDTVINNLSFGRGYRFKTDSPFHFNLVINHTSSGYFLLAGVGIGDLLELDIKQLIKDKMLNIHDYTKNICNRVELTQELKLQILLDVINKAPQHHYEYDSIEQAM